MLAREVEVGSELSDVLSEMFNLYIDYDKGEKPTDETQAPQPSTYLDLIRSTLAKGYEKLKKLLDTAGPELTKICNKVLEQNQEKNSPQNWADFIIACGNAAEQTQKKKYMYGQSRSCEILHMIRSYALFVLTNNDDEYKKAIDAKMAELKAIVDKLDKDIRYSTLKLKGAGVEEMKARRNQVKVDLAYLTYKEEDLMNISEAKDVGKLGYLFSLSDKEKQLESEFGAKQSVIRTIKGFKANEALPYCMQNYRSKDGQGCWFFVIHFEERFNKRVNKDWLRWLMDTRNKAKKPEAIASGAKVEEGINEMDRLRKAVEGSLQRPAAVVATPAMRIPTVDLNSSQHEPDHDAEKPENEARMSTSPHAMFKLDDEEQRVDPDNQPQPPLERTASTPSL